MKKNILFGSVLILALGISSCTTERVVVERPADPPAVVVKPESHPHKIYVDYEYRWQGGKYVLVPGHYIKERRGKVWVPGHWAQKQKGYQWVPGRWK